MGGTKPRRRSKGPVPAGPAGGRTAEPRGLKGFRTLPHPCSKRSDALRYFFYRRYEPKAKAGQGGSGDGDDGEEDAPRPGRTLLVCNVPRAYSFEDLAAMFACFGQVEQVLFRSPPSTAHVYIPFSGGDPGGALAGGDVPAQSAYVVYVDAASVGRAESSDMSGAVQPLVEGSAVPGGMRRWLEEYKAQRPDPAGLQTQVDRFMEAFDRRVDAERRAARSGPVVDEDGFTLITRTRGAKRAAPAATVVQQKKRAKEERDVVDFYRFQRRERKREELATLRRQFEEDKLKIARMREQRKFKPF